MELNICKGNINNISDCEVALSDSELGRRYFSTPGSARKTLEEGFQKEEIYVAVDQNGNCCGFLWNIFKGIFHSFPYIHIVAVKEEMRGLGIGKKLLRFAEDLCFQTTSKIFLVVADFNPDAKRLYEKVGYTEVGLIPSLYRQGINECLMMKAK